MKKITVLCLAAVALLASCGTKQKEVKDMTMTVEQKVKQYAEVELKTDISFLSESVSGKKGTSRMKRVVLRPPFRLVPAGIHVIPLTILKTRKAFCYSKVVEKT